MNRFKINGFEVQTEKTQGQSPKDPRSVRVEEKRVPVVEKYEFTRFGKPGTRNYGEVKARFGPLASTDPERPDRSQKDSRFALNDLVRGPLSVAEEERRAIEVMVQERLAEVIEEARRKGYEAGREQGLKQGHDEAFTEFQRQAGEYLERFEGLIGEAEGLKGEIWRANERYMIELVFRTAKMVLLRELKTDEQYVLRLARELVDRSGLRDNVHIMVSPQDRAMIGTLKESLEASLGTLKNLTVEVSKEISPGGCRIETDWNTIDATIDGQLEAVHQALLGELAAGKAEAGPVEGRGAK